jgi:hypothetical protein
MVGDSGSPEKGGIMESRKIITFTLVIAMTLLATVASARGLYLGAGIGNTFFSSEAEDALDQIKKIDENSTGYKLFAGMHGSRFIGVEGGYRSFGTIESTVSDQLFKSKVSGWDVEALGRIQVAVIDLFAKAGAMFWSKDITLLGVTNDDSGSDFFWGLGAGIHLGPIGARLEWESVAIGGPDNLSMVSLGATLGF